ncbi:1-acyl-sn-glycerol-3-phosphate acyltransferase [Zavarzinia compransoris]|uniref:1-acyl-sn-glycerol-3-phosphate acyltransferase n=1 Tax=Zavarzinia compransoris TaxID=1264899 RepID=A0A317EB39_9PROT|nr:1-acyl-sn-glycerol-3-phosphate acyltransferase [Zavarzinia compransoris]
MTWFRSAVFNLYFYAWTALSALVLSPALVMPRNLGMLAARFWVGGVNLGLRLICGITVEVKGRERLANGPVLIAAKHQSAWDTIALLSICGMPAVVLKRELTWIPLYGWYILVMRMIPIDRSAGAKALKDMVRRAKAAAAGGRSVLIFPQGTRVAVGTKAPYQPGVAALYAQLGLPCVPVALNSGLVWPRRAFRRPPGRITVEFLPPIPPGLRRDPFMTSLEAQVEAASDALAAVAKAGPPA